MFDKLSSLSASHVFVFVPQHKKLVEGTLYEEVTSASYSENDISNSLKNGILYLEDPIDHVSALRKHRVCSSQNELHVLTEMFFCVIRRRGRRTTSSCPVIKFTTQRRRLTIRQLMRRRTMRGRR